jgi:hypothetical protein
MAVRKAYPHKQTFLDAISMSAMGPAADIKRDHRESTPLFLRNGDAGYVPAVDVNAASPYGA